MTNQEWLSEWASTVRYSDTDDLHRKIFHEVVCVDKPEECEVKIADANEGKSLEVSLITESSTAIVSLEKR